MEVNLVNVVNQISKSFLERKNIQTTGIPLSLRIKLKPMFTTFTTFTQVLQRGLKPTFTTFTTFTL